MSSKKPTAKNRPTKPEGSVRPPTDRLSRGVLQGDQARRLQARMKQRAALRMSNEKLEPWA